MDYPSIPKTSPLPYTAFSPISPQALPQSLTAPTPPTRNQKNIFAFWNQGIHALPPYLLRNVLAWHRRFAPLGWTIYVLDTVPESPLNISRFIDVSSRAVVPEAFANGTLDGAYAAQHTSDLVRFPLLLRYGGLYSDVGLLHFGDVDALWTRELVNPASPREFAGFTMGSPPEGITIVNFWFMCIAGCELVKRAHGLLLKLWEGKTNTMGASAHELLSHVPLMKVPGEVVVKDEGGMAIDDRAMTDYAVQIQCFGAVQLWVDEEGGWDGPTFVREKCWLYSMVEGAFLYEQLTSWTSKRQHELFCLRLPGPGEEESEDQEFARSIVEKVVGESWCLKLGHGFSAKLFGAPTLGMLWRSHEGTDSAEGTYAGWLRWAELNCQQDSAPEPLKIPEYEPTIRGPLKI